jgi:outer membrane protein insertion porin family
LYWTKLFLLGFFISIFTGFPVIAQDQNLSVIDKIIVKGAMRIEPGTVRSYLLMQEGDKLDKRRIDQSLKSLFATGLFADVRIDYQGQNLVVKIVENPVINRIAFEGNNRIEDADLEKEINLRQRVVFTIGKVQADVKRITEVYRLSGRFAASVVPKIIQLPQNRADLVFEINEGPLTKIGRINFIGNKVESDSDLRNVIRTEQQRWYKFFTTNDNYDPDRLSFDKELLRRHYLQKGYADFRVLSSTAELTQDSKSFFITFSIEEGERYTFGNIDISSGVRGLNNKKLRSLIAIKKGDRYDASKVDSIVDKITSFVGNSGFAFTQVRPAIVRNKKNKNINLTFQIREGPRVFVERIDILGNVRTVDKVIRREFGLVEGDSYNSAKLRRSRQNIQNLDYFRKVDIKKVQGSAEDKAVIKVEVEEKPTGAMSFGVGYSTDTGPLLDIGISENNLLGRGQALTFKGSLAAERSTANISYTEPYFMERDVAAGFDLFHTGQDRQDTSSYNERKTGFGLRLGYPLSSDLRQHLNYKAQATSIEDVSSTASDLVKSQEGNRYLSQISHSLTLDKRDSKISPSEGFRVSMSNDVAGLGGNVRYLRNELGAQQFYTLHDRVIMGVKGKAGHIFGIDQDVVITDRFSLGGSNLRGFVAAGAGPRDISTNDSLGGEWRYTGSVQVSFPLGLPKNLGVSGRVFTDVGSLGSVNPSNSSIKDTGNIRSSVGTGIAWVSPMGPIIIDFSFPVVKESYDKTETIRFDFGTRF